MCVCVCVCVCVYNSTKGIQEQVCLGMEENPQEIMQESEFSTYWQMIYVQTKIYP